MFFAVVAIVGYLIQAAFIRAALDVTEGRQLGFGDFFKFVEPGPVILTALILALIGAVLNLIPVLRGRWPRSWWLPAVLHVLVRHRQAPERRWTR